MDNSQLIRAFDEYPSIHKILMEYFLETPVKVALVSEHHVLLLSLKISAGPPI